MELHLIGNISILANLIPTSSEPSIDRVVLGQLAGALIPAMVDGLRLRRSFVVKLHIRLQMRAYRGPRSRAATGYFPLRTTAGAAMAKIRSRWPENRN